MCQSVKALNEDTVDVNHVELSIRKCGQNWHPKACLASQVIYKRKEARLKALCMQLVSQALGK